MNNEERIARFDECLKKYPLDLQNESHISWGNVAFILADMMHWCKAHGIDIKAAEELATLHYQDEQVEAESV